MKCAERSEGGHATSHVTEMKSQDKTILTLRHANNFPVRSGQIQLLHVAATERVLNLQLGKHTFVLVASAIRRIPHVLAWQGQHHVGQRVL